MPTDIEPTAEHKRAAERIVEDVLEHEVPYLPDDIMTIKVRDLARILAARDARAEARGFERGRKEGGPVVAAVRALYTLAEFPHGEWSCGECGNVYPRDIIAGCPTCSPAARAALYSKEPR